MTDKIVVWGIGTPRTFRVYWTLEELGLAYACKPIRTRTSDMDGQEFLALSPGKKIPALQHGDLSLTESGAITHYLMDNFGSQNWSANEQAQINRWIFFTLMEIDATALYVLRRHRGLPEIYGASPEAVNAAVQYAQRQLDVVEQWLSDGRSFMVGNRFSEADIHLTSCLKWAQREGVQLGKHLIQYESQIVQRAAFVAAFKVNFPDML